jgi:hypothetical protein
LDPLNKFYNNIGSTEQERTSKETDVRSIISKEKLKLYIKTDPLDKYLNPFDKYFDTIDRYKRDKIFDLLDRPIMKKNDQLEIYATLCGIKKEAIEDNVKGDKIKALALAKECYAMKLELLTNATVVDDAIRFVASHSAAPATTEKANSDERVTVDEEVGNSDDIQGSEESRSHEQQSTAATTTINSIF